MTMKDKPSKHEHPTSKIVRQIWSWASLFLLLAKKRFYMVEFFNEIPRQACNSQRTDRGDHEEPDVVSTSVDLLNVHTIDGCYCIQWNVYEGQYRDLTIRSVGLR